MSSPHPLTAFAAGRYQIRRLLGEGGRKRVYLAYDTRLDREVALALIKTEGLDATGLARVRREAQAMGRVGDHPHIVTVYDVGDENGQPYIVTQYMAGGAVTDLLDGALSISRALSVADHVCRALEHAHAHGVIHRDLKPANVWLTADGTAKLGDFGLATSADRSRLTVEGLMVGTVAYMAPEQALGKAVDARSDLYALGALLYELVTGRPPFVGDNAVAVISQHLHTAPVAPSWHNQAVPPELEALILRLLEKDPARRPDSAASVRTVLNGIQTEGMMGRSRSPGSEPTPARGPLAPANPLDRLEAGIFVGREQELTALRAVVEDALAGRGRILLLAGEPGIGKTRTAQELTTYAQLRGMQVLWGRCHEGGGAPAYWPWVQALRTYVYESKPQELLADLGPGAVDIAQVISAVRERLPGLPSPPRLTPEEERFRLFDSLTTFLENAAARQPLVVVLDDLHWADQASLLLLQFLAREMAAVRLIVIGTYRDEEVRRGQPLSQALGELARATISQRIALGGLSEAAVGHYIELTARKKPPEGLVRAVFHQTEGNPFFVGEVVRLLAAEGRLEDGSSAVINIPPGVREVIARRLERLSAESNQVLGIAAVVGREFALELLARVSGQAPERLVDALEEAFAARMIIAPANSTGRYRFAHALIRDTLYDELSASRRLRLHRQIGEALEGLYGTRANPPLDELAYHFGEAAPLGAVDKAIAYARRAGVRAAELVAHEDAARHYERALRIFDLQAQPDDRERFELLNALGESRYLAGDRDQARATFQQAMAVAKALSAPVLVARAALGVAAPFVTRLAIEVGAFDPTMIEALEEALAILGDADPAVRVRLLACLANALSWSPARDRSRTLSKEAVNLARRIGDPAVLISALLSRQIALDSPESTEERHTVETELVQLAERTGDKQAALAAHDKRRVTLFELGRLDELETEVETFTRLATASRQPQYEYHVLQWGAMRALLDGRFGEAEDLIERTLSAGQRILNPGATQGYGIQLFLLKRERGALGDLEPAIKAFVERYPSVPGWRCGLALMYGETGRVAEARRHFEQVASRDFVELRRETYLLVTASIASEVCALVGDARRAALLYALLSPYARRFAIVLGAACYGSVGRYLGLLAAAMGRWDEAESHFAAALESNAALGARPWTARTQHDYAAMLLKRGAADDRVNAVRLLNEAVDTARLLGMTALLQQALALKLTAQGVDSSDPKTSIDVVAMTVRDERPDLRPHAAPDGTVTILFSDIEGFTALTERLGDQRAHAILQSHNRIVRTQVASHGGFVVKSQGDGFMVAFQSARRALLCAIAVQRALARFAGEHPEEPIRVRIGLHTGETIKEGDDFFGSSVNLAARIAAHAHAGEILVSALLKELTESAGDIHFGVGRRVTLKGISGERTVFTVPWARTTPTG